MSKEWRTKGLQLGLVGFLLATACGTANARAASAAVSNRTMTARLSHSGSQAELTVQDRLDRHSISIPELFTITLKQGGKLQPTDLHWDGDFTRAHQDNGAATICADLSDAASGAHFHWCLLNHKDRRYLRTQLTITAGGQDLPMTDVEVLGFRDAAAKMEGTVKGSPLADEDMYYGTENPLAWSRVTDGEVHTGVARMLPLRAHQSVTYSAVIGTYTPGQLRRDFLAYIEAERPRPYSPFLLYNTWYDLGYENRFGEKGVLNRMHAFGTELVTKRHVTMNSFVFDDGWDNPNSFWKFDSGFPDGFTRVAQAAKKYDAGIGVWLSPWGGYGEQKKERVAHGKANGYEIVNGGFALSAPKYFHGFRQVCDEMVDRYHVNFFKFDGTGNANSVFPGSIFDSDFAAAIHLIHGLRQREPGIFINLTTGTWASPFWLLDADSIWRGGDDHSFAGVGSERQQWITYRDEQTYRNIVERGPLFPLNSLMVHGMIYAQFAKGLKTDPDHDFRDEVLSYFGSGTQLQEMYITPSLLTQQNWDTLASAARWSRAHAGILEDTHWIGGDPGKLNVYGWAAWSPKGWIVTLRNPSNHPQDYTLNLKTALQLPVGAKTHFAVRQPFAKSPEPRKHWSAGHPDMLHLQPFEVVIFEAGR